VQDLEGDLGLVLGVERKFADGFAEVGERRVARATVGGVFADFRIEQRKG
jgi:hypothetical protein